VFEAQERGELLLLAPFTIYYELPAALLKAVRLGRLSEDAGRTAFELFARLPLRTVGNSREAALEIADAAYRLTSEVRCSYYDATFLGLADLLGTRVITAEDKVYNAFSARTPLLLWVEEAFP
jgi:predicted nucleic acid-binding protein